jgi:hypothetical protein
VPLFSDCRKSRAGWRTLRFSACGFSSSKYASPLQTTTSAIVRITHSINIDIQYLLCYSGLSLTVAEKGAPPFVRYLSTFTFPRSAAPVLPSAFTLVNAARPIPVGALIPVLLFTDYCPLAIEAPVQSCSGNPRRVRTAHHSFKSFSCNTYITPASVANKRLTLRVNPLDATLTKTPWGASY